MKGEVAVSSIKHNEKRNILLLIAVPFNLWTLNAININIYFLNI